MGHVVKVVLQGRMAGKCHDDDDDDSRCGEERSQPLGKLCRGRCPESRAEPRCEQRAQQQAGGCWGGLAHQATISPCELRDLVRLSRSQCCSWATCLTLLLSEDRLVCWGGSYPRQVKSEERSKEPAAHAGGEHLPILYARKESCRRSSEQQRPCWRSVSYLPRGAWDCIALTRCLRGPAWRSQ